MYIYIYVNPKGPLHIYIYIYLLEHGRSLSPFTLNMIHRINMDSLYSCPMSPDARAAEAPQQGGEEKAGSNMHQIKIYNLLYHNL